MIAEPVTVDAPLAWDQRQARRMVAALWYDLDAYAATLDPFDKPSLRRRELVAADTAIWAAWARQDLRGVGQAVAGFQQVYFRLSGKE